jgi:hypothetical protein
MSFAKGNAETDNERPNGWGVGIDSDACDDRVLVRSLGAASA